MVKFLDLYLQTDKGKRVISFGEAVTVEDRNDIYRLRYDVYSSRGYINTDKYHNHLEIDDYDDSGKCYYFVAKLDDKIIGSIRLIIDSPLPTQKYFVFNEPEQMVSIPQNKRCELGRFVIIPPNRHNNEYLPRGIIMLFLLKILTNFGISRGIEGGYSFIKKSLDKKFETFKVPIRRIDRYTQNYPIDGVLYKYFTQDSDPVVPVYFLTKDFYDYFNTRIHNSLMFEIKDMNTFVLKDNLYMSFLKKIKLI